MKQQKFAKGNIFTHQLGLTANAILWVFQVTSSTANAYDGTPISVSADLSIATLHESTIVIDRDEMPSTESGLAINTEANGQLIYNYSNRGEINAGLGLMSTRYKDSSDYNLMTEFFYAGVNQVSNILNWELNAQVVNAALGEKPFLGIEQIGPSISRLLDKNGYIRASVLYAERDYVKEPERNTHGLRYSIQGYYLLEGFQHHVQLNIQQFSLNARQDSFDYSGSVLALTWVKMSQIGSLPVEWRASVSLDQAQYGVTVATEQIQEAESSNGSPLGEANNNSHNAPEELIVSAKQLERDLVSALVTTKVYFSKSLYTELAAEYVDNQTNDPSYDYSQYHFEVRLGIRF